jgi:hypothetical protein
MEPENTSGAAPPQGRAALQVILVTLAVAAAAWVLYKLERVVLPLAVIVAILAGLELGGIAGMFLAIPAVALVSVTSRHWLEWRRDDEGPVSPAA